MSGGQNGALMQDVIRVMEWDKVVKEWTVVASGEAISIATGHCYAN